MALLTSGCLLFIFVDIALALQTVDLGAPVRGTCQYQHSAGDLAAGAAASTEFRITCVPACMVQSLENGNYSLFGLAMYSLDSDLCVAAVHDARLPHPGTLQSPAPVTLRVRAHNCRLTGGFRRGILGRSSLWEQHVVEFTSGKVIERVADVTTVHTHFHRSSADDRTYVECHVGQGTADTVPTVTIAETAVGPEQLQPRSSGDPVQVEGGVYRVVTSQWGKSNPPSQVLCWQQGRAYSDTTTIEFADETYFTPGRRVYVGSRGGNITLAATGVYERSVRPDVKPTWLFEGNVTVAKETVLLHLPHLEASSAGVYWLIFPDYKSYSSGTRLIVRDCAAGYYNADCNRLCPFCLHGGACHDVTGECVCPPGFHGPRCQHGCSAGGLGRGCWSRCPAGTCLGRLLCTPDPYGCSCGSGWSGDACNSRCRSGEYGPNCSFRCGRCRSRQCDRFTGHCSDRGCVDSTVLPPLCQPLWPWFREPPTLEEVSFTSIIVSHAVWSEAGDDGFGSGPENYRYRLETRRSEREPWTAAAPTIPHSGAADSGVVRFVATDLQPDTSYTVRIIVEDTGLGAATTDDKVPVVHATTNCARPRFSNNEVLQVNEIDADSVTFTIEAAENERQVCPYRLNVSIAPPPAPPGRRSMTSDPASEVEFTHLRPFTQYIVAGVVQTRKGVFAVAPISVRTLETAPSAVEDLQFSLVSPERYLITWDTPQQPNGVVVQYRVVVTHVQYKSCGSFVASDHDDVTHDSFSANQRRHWVTLKHPFSEYRVEVSAGTAAGQGPSTAATVHTPPSAPTGVLVPSAVTPETTSAQVTWSWPHCRTWGDAQANLRLGVVLKGASPWNRRFEELFNWTRSDSGRFQDLVPFSSYLAAWTIFNSVGHLNAPEQTPFQTLETVPGTVRDVTVVGVSRSSVTLRWLPPLPPYSRITEYLVTARPADRSDTVRSTLPAQQACTADSGCHAQLTRLTQLTTYSLTVFAKNARRQLGQGRTVHAATEGKPSRPSALVLVGRSRTALNVSWREPTQKNGKLRGFRLNITLQENLATSRISGRIRRSDAGAGEGRGRRRREVLEVRTYHIPVLRNDKDVDGRAEPYRQHIDRLRPGRTYLVSVSANTSAGYGPARTARLATLVAPPILVTAPRVAPESSTDVSVALRLPRVDDSGGPVSAYFIVVSRNASFSGAALTPERLLNAEESASQGLDYYVAAALEQGHQMKERPFVVGDGRFYNSSVLDRAFQNVPLEAGGRYRLGVAALSRLAADNQQLSFRPIAAAVLIRRPDHGSGIVAGVLTVLAILSLVTLLGAVIIWRRQNKKNTLRTVNGSPVVAFTNANNLNIPVTHVLPAESKEQLALTEDEDDDNLIYENLQDSQINFTRIEVADLVETTKSLIQSGSLKTQLQSLPHGVCRPCEYGRQPQHRKKNRYVDLIAYDHSRVVLDVLPDDKSSDYINANYVDGYQRTRAYIACQGPKRETVPDFWRMIWQEESRRIVMLTNLTEAGKRKCDRYWPEEGQPLQLPGMCVSLAKEAVNSDFSMRTFELVKGKLTRTVTHLHYTAWPDHSVPQHPSSLARFVRALQRVPHGDAPTVVHCSAGVGRTGTVILIDAMRQMGRKEGAVDIYTHLGVIRQQRANLCANLDQYKLVHQVLICLLASPDSVIAAADLVARVAALRSPAPESEPASVLQKQWHFLEKTRPEPACSSALAELRDGINRDPAVLPENSSRVYLEPTLADGYVNAVYAPGFRTADAFITTEAPLAGRTANLWHMVAQKRAKIVVVMNDISEQNRFWPAAGATVVYSSLTIENTSSTASAGVETTELLLQVFEAGQLAETRNISLLRLNENLPSGDESAAAPEALGADDEGAQKGPRLPYTAEGIGQLREEMTREGSAGAGPVLVVCKNGVTGCGLLVTCSFALEQLSEEHELDLVSSVMSVRAGRPQYIETMEQLDLCYSVALWWLEAFATYSNFQ